MAAIERKVRERNGCYLPGFSNEGQSYCADNRGVIDVRQPILTSTRNEGVLDVGPNISSPEESEDEELNRTITRQEVVEQEFGEQDVIDQKDGGKTADKRCGEKDVIDQKDGGKTADRKDGGLQLKSGDKKKKRRSQLELLGACSSQALKGLGLRSGRFRAESDTLLSEEDEIKQDENEDGFDLEDAGDAEF